jgi:hypothetical protein
MERNMPRHHTIFNAKTGQQRDVPFTAEEETARDAEEASYESAKVARLAAEAKAATDRAAGKNKLVAEGTITQDEADALFG